jgi:hypothetical protein
MIHPFQRMKKSVSSTVWTTLGIVLSCTMMTPYENAGMVSLYGGRKVSEGSTIVLCADSNIRVMPKN